jgi:transcriptional regulator with XRE-family HTH domain
MLNMLDKVARRRTNDRTTASQGFAMHEDRRDRIKRIDQHVAWRVRERRIMLGLTQQELAERIGVTYQQQHKYEKATNRISASRLYEMAEALQVPVSYFYEGLSDHDARRPVAPRERLALEMARSFNAIANPALQQALSVLARSLAPTEGETADERVPRRSTG